MNTFVWIVIAVALGCVVYARRKNDINFTEEGRELKIKKVVYVMLSGLLSIFLYILLHELGHVIVMLFAGATITDFSIIRAHVSAVGGKYTNLSDLWLQANGALLPMIISVIYVLFYKRENKHPLYIAFSTFVSFVPITSILAWVVIPFLYIQDKAPVGDDVTNFLFNFTQSHNAMVVSLVSMLFIIIGITLMIKKEIIKNFIIVIKER